MKNINSHYSNTARAPGFRRGERPDFLEESVLGWHRPELDEIWLLVHSLLHTAGVVAVISAVVVFVCISNYYDCIAGSFFVQKRRSRKYCADRIHVIMSRSVAWKASRLKPIWVQSGFWDSGHDTRNGGSRFNVLGAGTLICRNGTARGHLEPCIQQVLKHFSFFSRTSDE